MSVAGDGREAAGEGTHLGDVDGLVELAGVDVLAGGVLVLGELDVAGRVALLRKRGRSPAGLRQAARLIWKGRGRGLHGARRVQGREL